MTRVTSQQTRLKTVSLAQNKQNKPSDNAAYTRKTQINNSIT